ncbi:hypothetical protein F4561_002649 [Lipingzhangella halophila]|uniref:Uncharacterized protein n=1 Tax=Lipingzhangella halophila TaxID=1783352 RepID=A0A7W7W3I0_9ACTN|nr:hypothetical protein [Lipingzhangella halophila]MBB4931829.1 hypothetical protein [Lipingzhangella halophila]
MNDVLTSMALPAAVAGVVTLLIEWIAKPRLEARKERILAAHQGRFEVLKSCVHISAKLAMLRHNEVSSPETWPEIQRTLRDARSDLETLAHRIEEQLPLLYFTDRTETISVVAWFSGLVRGSAVSQKWHAEVAEQLTGPAVWTTDMLQLPRWTIAHRRARREVWRLMKAEDRGPGDEETTPA